MHLGYKYLYSYGSDMILIGSKLSFNSRVFSFTVNKYYCTPVLYVVLRVKVDVNESSCVGLT